MVLYVHGAGYSCFDFDIMCTLCFQAEEICAEVDDRLTFDTHSTVPNDDVS